MMEPDNIKRMLEAELSDCQAEVSGDGRHFQALIVSPDFEGKGLIQRHRMVNGILKSHFDAEVLHALSMRTLTPAENAGAQ